MSTIMAEDDAPFQVSLPGFEGPVDGLLRLVSQRKLAADAVSLADVTAQFLHFLRQETDLDLQLTGNFVVGSARLMALKSAFLVAEPLEEEEAGPVAAVDSSLTHAIQSSTSWLLNGTSDECFAKRDRTSPLALPVIGRSPAVLPRIWRDMLSRTGERRRVVTLPGFVRLEVALSRLLCSVRSGARMPFSALMHGTPRQDVVVHFLAMLELVRRCQITAQQDGLFDDIHLERAHVSADSASRAG